MCFVLAATTPIAPFPEVSIFGDKQGVLETLRPISCRDKQGSDYYHEYGVQFYFTAPAELDYGVTLIEINHQNDWFKFGWPYKS
jgi:hypothetical protein